VAVIGITGAILVFVLIVWLQAAYHRVEEDEIRKKVYDHVPEELARLRADQQEALHRYRWIDEKQGIVSIPIERAMEWIVAESAGEGGTK